MKLERVLSFVLLAFVLVSCAGQKGDDGAVGPAGPAEPGLYYVKIFQQGVYNSNYSGQVQASLTNQYSGATYTSQTMDIAIGKDSVYRHRAIIKFDISSLPSSRVIVEKAEMTIHTNNVFEGNGAENVGFYRLNAPWTVNNAGYMYSSFDSVGVAWPQYGAWETGSNTVTVNTGYYNLPPNTKITVELEPELIQDWMFNSQNNYGLIIKSEDENTTNYSEIYPSLAADTSKRPMLKIWYYTTE